MVPAHLDQDHAERSIDLPFLASQRLRQSRFGQHALRHKDVAQRVADAVIGGLDDLAVLKTNRPHSLAASHDKSAGLLTKTDDLENIR